MTKKIYIAGKVSGEPMENVEAKFKAAQQELEALGFEAKNPVDLVQEHFRSYKTATLNDSQIWAIAMRECIRILIECDGVLLLPCHLESRGALIEKQLAMCIDIPTYHDINKFIEIYGTINNLQSKG